MSNSTNTQALNVIARAPFHVYYEGKALMVSAENRVGKFDVLPGHADFFSVINPGDVIIETKDKSIKFNIKNGIVSVRGDEVVLFVNI